MGNICTSQKQQVTQTNDSRNTVKFSATLGSLCAVDLITGMFGPILGNFRQHKSDALLVFTESNKIQHCEPLREYSLNSQKTLDLINSQGKIFHKATQLTKTCPYKKIMFAIMPKYTSEQSQQYQQHLRNIMREALSNSKQITIETTNTIDGFLQLPNQMILAVMFRELQDWKSPVKVNLVSNENKMMQMYKFELLKTDACKVKYVPGYGKENLSDK